MFGSVSIKKTGFKRLKILDLTPLHFSGLIKFISIEPGIKLSKKRLKDMDV